MSHQANDVASELAERKIDEVVIWSDGACKGNPGRGSYAFLMFCRSHSTSGARAYALTTNNRMEMMGVISALSCLNVFPCKVDVYTDSRYIVDNAIPKVLSMWEQRDWKTSSGTPVANLDLWMRMRELIRAHRVTFHWVKGHANIPLNEKVDKMANAVLEDGSEEATDVEFEARLATAPKQSKFKVFVAKAPIFNNVGAFTKPKRRRF